MKYKLKPLMEERMKSLLPDKEDFKKFSEIIHEGPLNFIRCNTLKITPDALISRLSKKWNVKQPFPSNPEIILITSIPILFIANAICQPTFPVPIIETDFISMVFCTSKGSF